MINLKRFKFFTMKSIAGSFFLTLFLSTTTYAQIYFQENDTLVHEINQNTPKSILNKYLKSKKAKNIIFSEELPQYCKIQNKKGKWQLWKLEYGEEKAIHDKAYDEIEFPSTIIPYLAIVKNKGKYGVLNTWSEVATEFLYDSIIFANIDAIEKQKKANKEAVQKAYKEGTEIFDKPLPNLIILAQKKGLWGRIALSEEYEILVAEPFIYETPENVPTTNWDITYHLPYLQDLYKNKNIDLAQPVPQEIVYVTGRNKKIKKWGFYGGEGSFEELIKPAYDSIKMHKYPTVYEVWNQQKVGYYNSDFDLIFEPQFDDFEYVHLDYTHGCALKKNGKWELYDAYEPKKLIEGSATSIDKLIELWLDR